MHDDFSGLVCGCGSQHFRRVTIDRPDKAPHDTVLAECVDCHAAFVSPPGPPTAACPQAAHKELMTEIETAAKGYVKPGRHLKVGDKRRRPVR